MAEELNRDWPGRDAVLTSFGGDLDSEAVDALDRARTPHWEDVVAADEFDPALECRDMLREARHAAIGVPSHTHICREPTYHDQPGCASPTFHACHVCGLLWARP